MRIMAAVKARAKALNVIDVLHRKKAGSFTQVALQDICVALQTSASASALPQPCLFT